MHPLLDYSDVYQDITKWLESQAFLSSYDYTLNHMLLQAKQSELRVPPQSAAFRIFFPRSSFSWSIIAVTAEYSITVAHPY